MRIMRPIIGSIKIATLREIASSTRSQLGS